MTRSILALAILLPASLSHGADLILHWNLDDGIAVPTSPFAIDDGQDVLTPGIDSSNNRYGSFVSFGSPATQPLWRTSGGVSGSGFLHFDANTDVTNGYGMRFDETDGSLPSGPAYSTSLWFRASPTNGELGGLLGGLTSTVDNRYFETDAWSDTSIISAKHRGTNFATAEAPANPGYFDGNWHHVVGVFSATNSRSLYVDGVLVATNNTAANTAVNPVRFSIGLLDRPSSADFYNGDMDEVSVYRGALTQSEVSSLYAVGVPEPSTCLLAATAALGLAFRRRRIS